MQAVWSHEPPDQRFFRLYNIDVPMVEFESEGVKIDVKKDAGSLADDLLSRKIGSVQLPLPETKIVTRKLVDVADLDEVLGYKGNYTIFPLKENNYLTLRMMQDYLEVGDDLLLRDPDEFAELTVEELAELAAGLHERSPEQFEKLRERIRTGLVEKLASPRAGSDLVIVPTTSLYVEALVGTHPLLEDFKLIHRALDVKKVQADVRHQELENLRLGRRLFAGKDEDPDIDKKIVVSGEAAVVVGTE
jgi:hypothetical protein